MVPTPGVWVKTVKPVDPTFQLQLPLRHQLRHQLQNQHQLHLHLPLHLQLQLQLQNQLHRQLWRWRLVGRRAPPVAVVGATGIR